MPFPQTALVDDFNRADANPISGDWATSQGGSGLKIVSNAAMSAGATGVTCGSYSKGSPYGPDQEAFVDITTLPAITAQRVMLTLRSTDNASPGSPPTDATSTFYALLVTGAGGFDIRRYVNGSIDSGVGSTSLNTGSTTLSAGDTILFRVTETFLEAWIKHGGVWSVVVSFNDTNLATRILNGGWLGLFTESTTAVLDNFGGGGIGISQRWPLVEMYSQGRLKRQLAINLMQAKPSVVVAAGTTFVQGLTATAVAVTAALQNQVGKLVTATSVLTTASLVRQTGKVLTATVVVVTASVKKQVNKALTATSVVVTASLIAMKVILKVLTATAVGVTATLLKQVNKSLTATSVALSATLAKQVNKAMTATSVVVTASLVPIKVILRTLTATTVVVSASLFRQINKPLVATLVVLISSLAKQVNKKLTATTVLLTASLSAIKVVLKTLTATSVVVTASMVRQVKPVLNAVVVVTASVAKRVAKTLSASVSSLASLAANFVGQIVGPFAAKLGITDALGVGATVTDANIVSTSTVDAMKVGATVTDALNAQIGSQDVSGPKLTIDDKPA